MNILNMGNKEEKKKLNIRKIIETCVDPNKRITSFWCKRMDFLRYFHAIRVYYVYFWFVIDIYFSENYANEIGIMGKRINWYGRWYGYDNID